MLINCNPFLLCRIFKLYYSIFVKVRLLETQMLNLESAATTPRRKVAANTGYLSYPVLVGTDACKHDRQIIAGGRSMGDNTGKYVLQSSSPLDNQGAS